MTKEKLSKTTISLHWIVAFAMLVIMAMGIYMHETETFALYPIHKSLGFVALFVILARIAWRMKEGWPEDASDSAEWQKKAARAVHWILITGTALFPVSGLMMSVAGGNGLAVFGMELIARNPNPDNPAKALPLNETLAGLGHVVHNALVPIMVLAIVLHILGAVKHHLVDKDVTVSRMLGK